MTEPTPPEPDGKDWTWVITAPCPDCGFDAGKVARTQVPALTLRYADELRAALARPRAAARPQPAVWAPVEYACHVRDVCRIFSGRLRQMLAADDPEFDNWDQDVTALEDRYWDQDPAVVSIELATDAEGIADAFAQVTDDQWDRPGRRSNGSMFTVDTFARYFLHDLAHHAWDVSAKPR